MRVAIRRNGLVVPRREAGLQAVPVVVRYMRRRVPVPPKVDDRERRRRRQRQQASLAGRALSLQSVSQQVLRLVVGSEGTSGRRGKAPRCSEYSQRCDFIPFEFKQRGAASSGSVLATRTRPPMTSGAVQRNILQTVPTR